MKLLLIDGYGFVFRAYHSLPPLTNPEGLPIGAVYGFVNMLYKFISNHSADYVAVVLDSGQKNFRHELYANYKANRPPAPEDLVPQFPIIKEAVKAFGLKALDAVGFEADDLIATYTKIAQSKGIEVVVVSSDKDLMQLITDNVSMYDAMRDRKIGAEQVIEKFGVQPTQVLDVLALIGDSSDNIPGVKGIGPKTAAELINAYGNLENLYHHINELPKSKRKETLIASQADAFLSKKLASLCYEAPVSCAIEDLTMPQLEGQELIDFLRKQGFKTLMQKVAGSVKQAPQVKPVKELSESIPSNIEEIGVLDAIGFYINDSHLEICADRRYRVSLQAKQGDLFDSQEPSPDKILLSLKPLLQDKSIKKFGFNYNKLNLKLKNIGIELQNFHDLMVLAYSIDTANNDLSEIDVIKLYDPQISEVTSEHVLNVGNFLYEQLIQLKQVAIYEKIDKPFLDIIFMMQEKGILVDQLVLQELSLFFQSKITEAQTAIYGLAGEEFNIASPKQLAHILFDKLGIKVKAKGNSTSVEILEEIAQQGYEIAKEVLKWRHFSKLKNTYTDPLPKLINRATGRLHTTFSSTSTTTGRLSSQHPNLQNIPIRSEEGTKIRRAFIAKPEHSLISADYSQIELRLLAEIGDVKPLKKAFAEGQDIHTATAMEIFGLTAQQVDSEMRRRAKTINFGIIYGISAFGLSERLGIARGEAQAFIDLYFARYPQIKVYMENTVKQARESGYIKTLSGRRCSIKYINDKNYNLRSFAERAAINAPLQGTASDIIKVAMLNLPEDIKRMMVLQVHDELIFEAPLEIAEEISQKIKLVMESAYKLSVPLTVDVSIATSWDKL